MSERLDEFNHDDAELNDDDNDFLDDLDVLRDLSDEDLPDADEFYEMEDDYDDED